MKRYSVEVDIGRLEKEVRAVDRDAAIDSAISDWIDDAAYIIPAGTFSVRDLEEDV